MKLKASVLLIEENEGLRKLLSSFLAQDFQLHSEKDGILALGYLFSANAPDVVVMSTEMVRISGFDLIEQIRANGLVGDVPIIVLASEEDDNVKQRCFDLGANAFFVKPFSPDQLHRTIHELIPVSVHEN